MTVHLVLSDYIPTTNLIIFLLFAVVAYSIMFNKFYSSHRVARSRNQPNQSIYLCHAANFILGLSGTKHTIINLLDNYGRVSARTLYEIYESICRFK